MEDLTPIGYLKTCFTEKFGVPRQALMTTEARGVLKLKDDTKFRAALGHLDQFSHVWIVFLFHKNGGDWHPHIDSPRLDAPKNVGVFATRSPHRPNPIGLSAVKLDRVDLEAEGGPEIHLSGVDILDGTPVLDIKPYLPYADSIPTANMGWIEGEIEKYSVSFSPDALQAVKDPQTKRLIEQMLEWDPRPTSQRRSAPMNAPESEGKRFAFRILDLDVKWEIRKGGLFVFAIVPLP